MTTGEEPERSATTEQRLIGGHCRTTERWGTGGTGAVRAGRDVLADREVAVEQALTADAGPAPLAARIPRETRAVGRPERPRVYQACTTRYVTSISAARAMTGTASHLVVVVRSPVVTAADGVQCSGRAFAS